MELNTFLTQCRHNIDTFLDKHLPPPSNLLNEAIRYMALGSGKRIRASLVYATGEMFQQTPDKLHAVAASVELIHCYSLIHDDLPAMDDDDLRRGKPTCHLAFDEATAILTGDALQTLAFDFLSNPDINPLDASQSLKIISTLAQASGPTGMILGQSLDMAAENQTPSLASLEEIHHNKTGALISAALMMGLLAANVVNEKQLSAIRRFGKHIGLAFQIKDDLLDISSTTAMLGKPVKSDLKHDKATFPSILGIQATETALQKHHDIAIEALQDLEVNAFFLKEISHHLLHRQL